MYIISYFLVCFKGYGNVSVRNVAITPNGTFDEACGYAEAVDMGPPAIGEFTVYFPYGGSGDYWILDTDYENFASIYSCMDDTIWGKIEQAWILVRDPANVTSEVMMKAFNAYTSQNLTVTDFLEVSHENCTYENPTGALPCTGGNWGPPPQ